MMGRKLLFLLLSLVLFSACSVQERNTILESHNDTISPSASSASALSNSVEHDEATQSQNNQDNINTHRVEEVRFPHIYEQCKSQASSYSGNVVVSFQTDSAIVLNSKDIKPHNEFATIIENTIFDEFKGNLLFGRQGAYGMELVICELLSDEWFVSNHYRAQSSRIWDNNVIGLINDVEREGNEPEKLRPVFLNTRLEELPLELDFDYGEVFKVQLDEIFEGGTLTFEQYIMLGLTYNAAKDEYIALYTINPFWENTTGIPNTMQCEMGIAVFDNSGKKLEQYQLPQVIYPVDYSTRSGLEVYIPQLFVRENSLLVVYQVLGYSAFGMEQEYFEQSVKGTAFLVNLATHGAKRLPKEELLEFVTTKLHMEANLNASHNWEATKPVSDPPFKIVEQDNVQLVYLPNEEQPLFAVHPSFRIRDWTQTEDGMYHAIFSK